MGMKRIVMLLIVSLALTASCKKIVEDTKKAFVLDVITDGQWYIKSYEEAGSLITSQFNGYKFQFYEDLKLTAFKGASTVDGTWTGDITNYSVTTNFADATEPLNKLNGTWILKDSGDNYVIAEMDTNQGKMHLTLEKVPA